MGIIINQSIKNMVTTYLGFAIGAVNTLFLFTYFLTKEYYGLVSFLLSAANLIWPFLVFGVLSTLIKFFTSYKTRKEQELSRRNTRADYEQNRCRTRTSQ